MALATPEWTAPIRIVQSSRVMKRSAMRLPVAGVVSVSAVVQTIFRPSTPPLALNSSIAILMPRRSSCPLLPYWPLASQVRPSLIGLPPCANTRFSFHGPKKLPAPPMTLAISVPFKTLRRETRFRSMAPSRKFLLHAIEYLFYFVCKVEYLVQMMKCR